MAKRFTDTQLWFTSWYMDLTSEEKNLWRYMNDNCDHAGVWEVNWKLTSYIVGFQFKKLPKSFEEKVLLIDDNKLWLKDFCEFQYGTLNPKSKPHKSVIDKLEKYNIPTLIKGYTKGIDTLKDKDKDKDKDKVKVKRFKKPTLKDCKEYFEKMNYINFSNESEKFFNYYESNGWKVGKNKMVNWHMSAGNWNKNATERQSSKGYSTINRGNDYADL